MSKWITFSEVGPSITGKTIIWYVYSSKDEDGTNLAIGEIRWFGRWRKYAFFPDRDTIYEQDCLRDLAQFCEDKTKAHRSKNHDR